MAGGWGTDWGTDWGGGWDVPGGGVRRLQGTIQNLRPKALRSNFKLIMWTQPPEVVEEKCDPIVDVECAPVETAAVVERVEIEKELAKDEAFDAELDEATKPKS